MLEYSWLRRQNTQLPMGQHDLAGPGRYGYLLYQMTNLMPLMNQKKRYCPRGFDKKKALTETYDAKKKPTQKKSHIEAYDATKKSTLCSQLANKHSLNHNLSINQCCGSGMLSRIPDSNFSNRDPGSSSKNLSILTQKIVF
jgi:hypothetical protein